MPERLNAQYSGEHQRLFDERPRRKPGVGFLWMHHATAQVSNRTTESLVTSKLRERRACREVLHYYVEQLHWLQNRGWVNQLWHKFPAEILYQRRFCLCLPTAEYSRLIDRWILIAESPGRGISQKKIVNCRSAVCGRWRWSAAVRWPYVGNDEGLWNYLRVLDQACFDWFGDNLIVMKLNGWLVSSTTS